MIACRAKCDAKCLGAGNCIILFVVWCAAHSLVERDSVRVERLVFLCLHGNAVKANQKTASLSARLKLCAQSLCIICESTKGARHCDSTLWL